MKKEKSAKLWAMYLSVTIMLFLFPLASTFRTGLSGNNGQIYGAEIIVSSASQLENAVDNLQPGDTVTVTPGTYNVDGMSINSSGTVLSPIVIRSQDIGMAELTGEGNFSLRQCEYVIIEGFLFTGTDETAIKLEACNNIRITRNTFRLQETESLKWLVVQGIWNDPNAQSHHNRIDHNLFENKFMPGNFITIDGSGDPVYQSSQYDRIDHNHFRNIGPRHPNEMEAVRVGWSELSMSSGFTVVEYNLFEDCDGDPEIISVKTSDDTIRYNTFRRSQGTLSLRHGNRSVVAGNFFFGEGKPGTGGIRVYGDDHQIYNNYFQDLTGYNWDAPITLTNGDYDGGSNLTRHFRINRAIIAHNTLVNNDAHIEIGFTNNGNYTRPPRDVVMINNLVYGKAGQLVKAMTAPVNMSWEKNLMFPDSAATLGISAGNNEIRVVDPQLTALDGIWKLSSNSPAIDSASSNAPLVNDDIEGQARDAFPDIGADEYATTPLLRKPLTAEDVGPYASEIITGIQPPGPIANELRLYGNYPNPFNPETTIYFTLRRPSVVRLEIFDIRGALLAVILNGKLSAGEQHISWSAGEKASGIYFYRLSTERQTQTGKMILIR